MIPSSRQQLILDEWLNTDNNILISAVAGSGKTSTLLMLLEHCQYRTLFVAFNKAIQEEIQNKMDQRGLKQGKAMTMHALGLTAIRGAGIRFSIQNNKNWNILSQMQNENRGLFRSIPREDKLRLLYSLIDMNDVSRMFLTDDIGEIRRHLAVMDKILMDHNSLPNLWNTFLQYRARSYEGNNIEIDFADMLYLPVIRNLAIPVYPYYLMVDEAQDLSVVQHRLLDILLGQNTIQKWIAVGDRNQAIYGFSGALSNSFDKFLDKPGNTVELPLDICYRCAKSIIASSNEVYPVMVAAREDEGIVDTISDPLSIKNNSMVICRNSGPLISLYFTLLSLGKSCYINGSEIMAYLLKFLKPYENHTIYSATVEMNYKLQELMEKENDSEDGKFKFHIFNENYENFIILSTNMSEPSEPMSSFTQKLKFLFNDRGNAIMLCTIHKSKGLENDVVYILEESLIPSKFAKSPEQLRQEKNLKYVARTRARNEMYFLNLPKKEEKKLII